MKIYYRRNLPHFQFDQSYYFITFRLYNSLQREVIDYLKNYYRKNKNEILKIKDPDLRSDKLYELQKRYFGIFDRHLDTNRECINYLCDPRISGIVKKSIEFRDGQDYETIAYCIMPNHVHLLIHVQRFLKPLYKIMQSLKRHTGRESNKIINRLGSFWHEESYDHIVRNERELININNYIMNNPVKAGLVSNADDWKNRYSKLRLRL